MAHHFGIVDRGHPRCGDRIGNFSRTGFCLQQCQQRRSVEDRCAHSPESSRRPARNASTDASDFPAVYFRASACACAIDWATVRRMTPSGVSSTSSEPPPARPRRLRIAAGKLTRPFGGREDEGVGKKGGETLNDRGGRCLNKKKIANES